jgi:hypothetical protein
LNRSDQSVSDRQKFRSVHENWQAGVVRLVPCTLSILSYCVAALASDIREFDIATIERLGNELTRRHLQGQRRKEQNPLRERAKQTAIAALKGKLFNIAYSYEVLDDPDGSGFLV